MQSHLVHQLIHDEGCPRHIARIFHEGDKGVQYQDIRQEDDNASHAADDSIHQKVFQRSVAHRVAHEVADDAHQPFYPSHRIFSDAEGYFKHDPHEEDKDGEAQYLVRNERIYQLRAGYFPYFIPLEGFAEGTVDEAVARIGEGGLAVLLQQLFDLRGIAVALLQDRFGLREILDFRFHFLVALQQFDGEVTLGDAGWNVGHFL